VIEFVRKRAVVLGVTGILGIHALLLAWSATVKLANIALLLRRLVPVPNAKTFHYRENSSNTGFSSTLISKSPLRQKFFK